MRSVVVVVLLLCCSGCASRGSDGSLALSTPGPWSPAVLATPDADEADEADDDGSRGVGHTLLLYLPDRLFDLLDIVRARVRIGPGIAVDARATELADVFVGSYFSAYVGLPGPRGRRIPVLPVGLETRSGVEVSAADVTAEGALGPDYGLAEVGVGLQLLIVGVDVGVDPFEIVDFVVGLFTFDPGDDDL